jgi:hypothetical protein
VNGLELLWRYRMKRIEIHIRGRKRGAEDAIGFMRNHHEVPSD